MKKFSIAILLIFGLFASESSLSQMKGVEYDNYGKPLENTRGEFTVNRSVNLRSEPNSNSEIVGVLPAGAIVLVDGAIHGHYKITYEGKTGYSWHKFFHLRVTRFLKK